MSLKFSTLLVSTVCVVGLISLPAGAQINYGDRLGVAPGDVDFIGITEDSTTDGLPLFGAPTRVGNQLLFFPQTFQSSSAGGSSDVTGGTLSLIVRADAGYYLDVLVIEEFGDYTLAGVGTPATFANISATLSATDVTPGTNGTLMDTVVVVPPVPYALPVDSSGAFSGSALIDLTGLGISEVALRFENTLETGSELGTTSFIGKRVIGGPAVGISVIPEPASLCLLALGGLALIRRRRP